jgi:hypothetical protein
MYSVPMIYRFLCDVSQIPHTIPTRMTRCEIERHPLHVQTHVCVNVGLIFGVTLCIQNVYLNPEDSRTLALVFYIMFASNIKAPDRVRW